MSREEGGRLTIVHHKWLAFVLSSAVALLLFAAISFLPAQRSRNNSITPAILPERMVTTPTPSTKQTISGMVVPHHDLVKSERNAFFEIVADQVKAPKTVILISPNHYESGQSDIQTTLQTWNVSEGDIKPNKTVIDSLLVQNVAEEPGSFINEHGIKLILGDIKRKWPDAQIVPLILKFKTSPEKITALHNALNAACSDCFMIASVDFSHYQPALLANLHDALTERALKNRDEQALLKQAEVDSPSALALFAAWAKSHDTKRFKLHKHTNSGEITKDPTVETTTHIFGWYETGDPIEPEKSVSFLIGGDMMFGRSIAHNFLPGGLWKSLDQLGDRLFWGTDAGIVNVEGPISDIPVPDDTRPNNLVFNFPPETIEALQYLNVNTASLANNHSANAGTKGLETTRRLLQEANIEPIGGPSNKDVDKVVSMKGQGLTLHIIGVHTLASVPDLKLLIQKLKQDPTARVLVFPHWGAEYLYKHGQSQTNQAHAWIDAGADLVIGAHPHVIQDSELYKGKPIIYSLGNLLFDQSFSKETQQGLLIAGEFKDDGLRLFALPTQATKYKPALAKGETKKSLIDRLYEPFTAQKQSTPAGEVLYFDIK